MKSRTAIQFELGGKLVVDEVDIPDPKANQVIVKLFSTGVCHSQIHQMHDSQFKRPCTMGHEATGVVTHLGSDVTHVNEGDHVIVTWVDRLPAPGRPVKVPPGITYKGELIHDLLAYTWGDHVLLKSNYVVPIDKRHPTDISCIVGCAVLTGAGAVLNTAKVRPGDSVAVFGVGGVGLSAVQMASILEAYPIIAVDLDDTKLEFAKEFGATHVINASKHDPVETIIEMTNGGVDFAFDAIGVKVTSEQILPITRSGGPGADNHGGMSVLIGVPANDAQQLILDPTLILYHQRQYRGSLGATYPERDFPLFLKLYEEGKFPLDKLVTKRYTLDQINEAYDDLQQGKILGRAIIEF